MAEYPAKVDQAKQNRHIRGSKNYGPTRIELTYDAQTPVDRYKDTADPAIDGSHKWTNRSRFEHDETIGVHRAMDGIGF